MRLCVLCLSSFSVVCGSSQNVLAPGLVAGASPCHPVSMACLCFLPDCPQCHTGPDDAWRFDGRYVSRVHHRPRYHFFTPTGVQAEGIPVAVEKLLNHRITKIMKSGTSASFSQYDEDWLDPAVARSFLPYLWVGESIFEVAAEHISQEQVYDDLAGAEKHLCIQLQSSGASVQLPVQPACVCFMPDCNVCNNSTSSSSGRKRNVAATQSSGAHVLGRGKFNASTGAVCHCGSS